MKHIYIHTYTYIIHNTHERISFVPVFLPLNQNQNKQNMPLNTILCFYISLPPPTPLFFSVSTEIPLYMRGRAWGRTLAPYFRTRGRSAAPWWSR